MPAKDISTGDEGTTSDFLTIREAACYLRLSRQTLYKSSCRIPKLRVGRRILISKTMLTEYLRECIMVDEMLQDKHEDWEGSLKACP